MHGTDIKRRLGSTRCPTRAFRNVQCERVALTTWQTSRTRRKDPMLAAISVITGVCAGVLALIQAQRQPEKARQLRVLSLVPFGMAGLMALLFLL